ncbi:8-amino-7-oxononanoate synthase [Lacipirellula limnantheis]|uniref:8-amino-7-ketopelargonate synthase n=1 Tax=Lacipirellula limnantheis TaxID=2528024 RepID=A0A517U683_9BACT|nr:8-amino-7-oxononanoate synthase [Lacipirellula limnantheis]QDT76146.1 8-amino-7-oxononanoate synthase [Lacipirellula limnantheis]
MATTYSFRSGRSLTGGYMPPLDWISAELAELLQRDLLRELPAAFDLQTVMIEGAGQRLINFASNDYLGLAADPRLVAAATEACQTTGVGRGSSPLICGRSTIHAELERRLAEFEHTEAALLFPSGFAANAGVVPALADRGDAIFADAKNHASLIDGCRLSRAETHVYRHNDAAHLAELLAAHASAARRTLIVTDTLFSMDGDVAPLAEIAALARRYDAMLLLDEAHATGVFGDRGRGLAEAAGIEYDGLIRVGTLSKAFGAAGGFVVGPQALIDYLANRARSYVFSTAQPASTAAAALVALHVVADEPQRRTQLLAAAATLRKRLQAAGWRTGDSRSQIIPIAVGPAADAVALSQRLREAGFWVPAIRPPSVPPGESLLRLSLTASHTPEMVDGLLAALGTNHQDAQAQRKHEEF